MSTMMDLSIISEKYGILGHILVKGKGSPTYLLITVKVSLFISFLIKERRMNPVSPSGMK